MLANFEARPLPWRVGETHESMSCVVDAKGAKVCRITEAASLLPGFDAEELAEMLCLHANTVLVEKHRQLAEQQRLEEKFMIGRIGGVLRPID